MLLWEQMEFFFMDATGHHSQISLHPNTGSILAQLLEKTRRLWTFAPHYHYHAFFPISLCFANRIMRRNARSEVFWRNQYRS